MDPEVDLYVKTLTIKGDATKAAACDLLAHNVCARCCIRFVGNDSGSTVYAKPAPSASVLLQQLRGKDTKPEAPAQAVGANETMQQEGGGSTQSGHSTPQPTCPACLGLLQALDTTFATAPLAEDAKYPEPDGDGGKWRPLANIAPETLKQALQEEGQVPSSFSLEVSVPLSVALRDVVVFRYLEKSHPLAVNGKFGDAVMTAKDALRMTLMHPLVEAMGHPCIKDGCLRVSIMLPHTATTGDPERVLTGRQASTSDTNGGGHGGGGGGRGGWGRGARAGRHAGHKRDRQGAAKAETLASGTGGVDQTYQEALHLSPDLLCTRLPFPPAPSTTPPPPCHAILRVVRRPLLVGGRYLKLKRGLPQTPFNVEEGLYPVSVQDILEEGLLPCLKAEGCKFYSSGREDIDVRMLGPGRPFVLEVVNPRAPLPPPEVLQQAAEALKLAKRGVEVVRLHDVSKDVLASIKEGEQHKEKTYEALCWVSRPLTDADVSTLEGIGEIELQQGTPVRVLHRRAPLTRAKMVRSMKVKRMPGKPQYFKLQLTTSAGTYVKEFVNGDFGRTVPSVGSLLDCHAEILQLDVIDVHLDVEGF